MYCDFFDIWNTYFADIGLILSERVNNTNYAHFTDYFTFELITEEKKTIEILNNLKPKPSCGYDGISTKL